MERAVLVYTTYPSIVEAERAGRAIVERRLAASMVTGNANGWIATDSGVVKSYGNNSIDGNAGNEGPPPGIALK